MLANVALIREDAAMDFDAQGLLAGLEGEDRAKRRRLLERLADDGYSGAELVKAVKENRLALLPVERVLGGTYTASEVEERAGLPAGTMARIRRQHGLPAPESEDRVFSDEDVEAAKSMKLFLDAGFADERVDEITRVLGEGMGRLSATIAASFVETFLEAGESEDEVALRFAELAEQLTPAFAPILVAAFTAHLRDSVQRGVLGLAELEAGDIAGAQDMAVCFADLVGFTRLGGQVEVGELSTVAGRLASLADLADPGPGPPGQDHRRRRDVRQPRARAARRGRAEAGRRLRGGRAPQPAGRHRVRADAAARRRLLRQLGQPGQPGHRRGPPRQRPLHPGDP